MAYNDAPSAKVPPFPDQFQESVEPVNPNAIRSNYPGLFTYVRAHGIISGTRSRKDFTKYTRSCQGEIARGMTGFHSCNEHGTHK